MLKLYILFLLIFKYNCISLNKNTQVQECEYGFNGANCDGNLTIKKHIFYLDLSIIRIHLRMR